MPSASGDENRPFARRRAPLWGLRGVARGRAVAAVLSFAAAALATPSTRAEEGDQRLVILVDPGVPTLARRLREEVEALGLEVRSVPAAEPDVPLEERARASGAVAAIRIAPSGKDAVEMTIVDRATGKTVQRRLAITTPSDPASAELIATRTVELLRASLMELASAHPPRGAVSVPPEVTESVVREPGTPIHSLGFGPGVSFGTGGPPYASGWVTLTLRGGSGFGVGAAWVAPIGGPALEVPEGSVELSPYQYRLAGIYETGSFGPKLSVRAMAGAFLLHLAVEGETEPPYVGESVDLFAGGPWIGTGLRLGITQNLGALLSGDLGVTFPRLVIRSAGREVSTWGRVLGTGTVGLEVVW